MTDLREKIVGCLRAWTEDIIEDIDAHGEVCCAESAEDLAERILALLPKLRWDGDKLKLGDLLVGWVYGPHDHNLYGGTTWNRVVVTDVSGEEARDAVEAAVRKALGLE